MVVMQLAVRGMDHTSTSKVQKFWNFHFVMVRNRYDHDSIKAL